MNFRLGEVRPSTEEDFFDFFTLSQDETDWNTVYSKKLVKVMLKTMPGTNIKMIKGRLEMPDVSMDTLYDVIHDADYRKKWDKSIVGSQDVGYVSDNSDVIYFAIKSPPPFMNRDFVCYRSWTKTSAFAAIFNHSVFHSRFPPRAGYIRALSYLSGYLLLPGSGGTSQGCTSLFITQADPGGKLPAWIVNKFTQIMAPTIMKKLHRVARAYPAWKQSHSPELKPWLHCHQRQLLGEWVPINMSEVLDKADFDIRRTDIDESTKSEADFEDTAEGGGDD